MMTTSYELLIEEVRSRYKNETGEKLNIVCPRSRDECIQILSTYECHFKKASSGEVVAKLPLPVGTRIGNQEYDDPGLKGYFIIDGRKRVIVPQERRDFLRTAVTFSERQEIYICKLKWRETLSTGDEGDVSVLEIEASSPWGYGKPIQNRKIKEEFIRMRTNLMVESYMASQDTKIQQQSEDEDEMVREGALEESQIEEALATIRESSSSSDPDTFREAKKKRPKKTWLSADVFAKGMMGDEWMNKVLVHTRHPKKVHAFLISTSSEGASRSHPRMGRLFESMDKAGRTSLICIAICRVIETVLGLREPDELDDPTYTRIETPAHLVRRVLWSRSAEAQKRSGRNSFAKELKKRCDEVLRCMRTGKWTSLYNLKMTGVSGALSVKSDLDSISHIRKISVPVDPNTSNKTIRGLHKGSLGFTCVCETPEGKEVGITKHLASTCEISLEPSAEMMENLKQFLEEMAKQRVRKVSDKDGIIFLNGIPLFFIDIRTAVGAFFRFRSLHNQTTSNQELPSTLTPDVRESPSMNIHVNKDGEIRIACDSGRLIRPLVGFGGREGKSMLFPPLPPQPNALKLWEERRIMVDPAEQSFSPLFADVDRASMSHSHGVTRRLVEISKSSMFGLVASTIPFSNHNQSPRIVFQCSMSKQAIPLYSEEARSIPYDLKLLAYGQKPLCTTKASVDLGIDTCPNGINVNVAILCYSGYNQEDAIIFSKSAVERDLFSNVKYHTIEITTNPYLQESFVRTSTHFERFDEEGIIRERQVVRNEDVVAVKYCPQEKDKRFLEERCKLSFPSCVEKVMKDVKENGSRIIRIIVRSLDVYVNVGDKFTSRHAQKGVASMMMNQEDLPFDADGITPDIIINPHCIPSRMTMGQILETCFSTLAALRGETIDGSPFEKRGSCEAWTKRDLYCGMTGKIAGKAFVGLCYYQALRHQAKEKAFSRSEGSIQTLSRQPVEGRAKGGGLRFGEMEKDCLIAHGAYATIQDRLMNDSDPIDVPTCRNCGETEIGNGSCKSCGSEDIVTVRMPYSFRLLCQETVAANMRIRGFWGSKGKEHALSPPPPSI